MDRRSVVGSSGATKNSTAPSRKRVITVSPIRPISSIVDNSPIAISPVPPADRSPHAPAKTIESNGRATCDRNVADGASVTSVAAATHLSRHAALRQRGAARGGRELGPFEVDEEGIERRDKGERDAVDTLAIAAPGDIGFPGAAEDAAEGVAEQQHLAAVERVPRR